MADIASWIERGIVYLAQGGSQAYGLATAESDNDYRGACIPPLSYYFGLDRFEQADGPSTIQYITAHLKRAGFPSDNSEAVVWSLDKFIRLAADGNPNMLELMFTPEDSIVYVHPVFRRLLKIRHAFLSTRLKHRFSGYAMSQLKRMRTHYHWNRCPPIPPTRADFGIEDLKLPKDQIHAAEKLVEFQIESWAVDQTNLPEDIRIQIQPQMLGALNAALEQVGIEKLSGYDDVLARAADRGEHRQRRKRHYAGRRGAAA